MEVEEWRERGVGGPEWVLEEGSREWWSEHAGEPKWRVKGEERRAEKRKGREEVGRSVPGTGSGGDCGMAAVIHSNMLLWPGNIYGACPPLYFPQIVH